jgi:hypothetical protein
MGKKERQKRSWQTRANRKRDKPKINICQAKNFLTYMQWMLFLKCAKGAYCLKKGHLLKKCLQVEKRPKAQKKPARLRKAGKLKKRQAKKPPN